MGGSRAALGVAWVALVLAVPGPVQGQATQEATVVIAVRHAERADQGPGASAMVSARDPELSEVGLERAICLAHTLEHAGVTRVFTSPYRRTRSTASPVAEMLGLAVEEYDPRAMDDFAERLRGMGGTVLVVGHSNTTPHLVGALGGDPSSPIAEDEYERLYTVFLAGDTTRSTLTRFCPAG